MAVRKIEYTVSADGIIPSVKQFAGVQGDHKATELIFNIHPTLYESLTEQLSDGGKLIYRFDGYDGEGGFCRSDTGEFTGPQVTYFLGEWLTRFGGIIKVILVISLLKDDLTEMELYSFPALLQLKNLPVGAETDGESYESMSVLAQVAKDSASTAVESADVAVEAQKKTEFARAALENGTAWVFDGGDADTNSAEIKFIIDNEMSDNSENAVENKVIKEYVDNLIDDLKKQAKLDAHPVGSYYWSSEATEPSILFGGEWEQVQGKFILAAGTYTDKNGEERSFDVGGNDNGEYSHTLTVDEMPKHQHKTADDGGYFLQGGKAATDKPDSECIGTSWWTSAALINTGSSGNSQPHNNMPPYEVAYCWKRIA